MKKFWFVLVLIVVFTTFNALTSNDPVSETIRFLVNLAMMYLAIYVVYLACLQAVRNGIKELVEHFAQQIKEEKKFDGQTRT